VAVHNAVFIQGVCTVSPRTVRWLEQSLEYLLRFANCEVGDISAEVVALWHRALLEYVSPTTANNYLRGVRVVMARLVNRDLLDDNPAAVVPYHPQPPHRPEAVTVETYHALLAVAGLRDAAIVSLLWGTGCRIGEIATISTETMDLWQENGEYRFAAAVVGKYHRRHGLGHATRYVYANDQEAEALRAWLVARPATSSPALFTSRDGRQPIPNSTIQSALRALKDRAGVDSVCNPHAFRHAFAYRKRREGYPLEWISEWLGHSDPAFTAAMYGDKTEREIRNRYFARPPRNRD
jgi:integrase